MKTIKVSARGNLFQANNSSLCLIKQNHVINVSDNYSNKEILKHNSKFTQTDFNNMF